MAFAVLNFAIVEKQRHCQQTTTGLKSIFKALPLRFLFLAFFLCDIDDYILHFYYWHPSMVGNNRG